MNNKTIAIIVATTAAIIAVAGIAGYVGYVTHARSVLAAVEMGMTKDEVRASIGAADKVILPRERLERWGNHSERDLASETWVYFAFPQSQHRLLVTFDADRVSDVAWQQN